MSRSSRRASSSPTLPTAACSTVLFRGVSAAPRRQREHYNQRAGASACGSSRRISAGRSTRCRCIGRQSIGSCLCRVSCPRVHLNRADGGGKLRMYVLTQPQPRSIESSVCGHLFTGASAPHRTFVGMPRSAVCVRAPARIRVDWLGSRLSSEPRGLTGLSVTRHAGVLLRGP